MISEFLSRLHSVVTRKGRGEFDEEIQFHLEEPTSAKMTSGLGATEARRQALIEFGGLERTRNECARQWPRWWLGTVLQDVRYAFRGFRHNTLFTISVLITLALGIGATTAVFSFVDRILFRQLPYTDSSRIVSVGFAHSLEPEEFMMGRFYVQWQDDQRPFSDRRAAEADAPCATRHHRNLRRWIADELQTRCEQQGSSHGVAFSSAAGKRCVRSIPRNEKGCFLSSLFGLSAGRDS